ncbi:hypothetical protein [Segetibacter aerophilus]|uniref:PEGA domain-containing protein n=1 Tax=Segetibacter aerophilus TaxID=670293 RepID=A0A512BDI6_9BACT|nr:hypothetical protein [Segetibacter aerophilus]GEO10020.1 hypothetical protein SAE01_25160 [Segetibacter aerophilus]
MATVIVNRKTEVLNLARNYGIYIDGKKVGTVANGETKEFNVSPGNHTVLAKIDWCSSPVVSFEVEAEGVKSLTVGGFKHGNWFMSFAPLIIILASIVNVKYGNRYLVLLSIPVFLLLTYYLTLGRKKYLTLT